MDFAPSSNVDLTFEHSRGLRGKYLFLDTETTGLMPKQVTSEDGSGSMPRILQIAWLLFDDEFRLVSQQNRFIRQDLPIPVRSTRIHGIDDTSIRQKGEKAVRVWNDFLKDLENCEIIVAHNIEFDLPLIEMELGRLHIDNPFAGKKKICTMKSGKDICKIPADDGNGFRFPALEEMYKLCVLGHPSETTISGLHDAWVDAALTAKVFFHLLQKGLIDPSAYEEESFKIPVSQTDRGMVRSHFFVNIILPTVLTILLFLLTIFLIIIPRFKENIMIGKREMIRELTNSAASILEKYEADERSGLMTREVAQATAISRIQYLRYGDENKDYFWITDEVPTMIMHPYRSDLNGKSLTNFSDPHGKRLFVEMVNVTKVNGHGYVEYMWQWKDDSTHIVPKLSYVKVFKPWGWIIGTGIYLEDVKKQISSLTNRLLVISLCISLIIALLLTYISLQSMKIEGKRKEAESLLRISREKYKTLVDATSEGQIMILDHLMIFFNNKILELTGYAENELMNQSFRILVSDINSSEMVKSFQNRNLPDGQVELKLLRKDGTTVDTMVTISSLVFAEKKGKLITVRDASVHKIPEGISDSFLQLLEVAGLGFIRILLDEKGKILYASRMVIQLLGFAGMKELTAFSILDFFTESSEKKKYRQQLLTAGGIRNAEIHLRKRDGSVCIVSVSMIMLKNEGTHLLCDGVIEEITNRIDFQKDKDELITHLQSHALTAQHPIDAFIHPIREIAPGSAISEAIRMMKANRGEPLIVTGQEGMRLGIITPGDIAERVLLTGLSVQNPVYSVMSAPLISLERGRAINEAFNLMHTAGVSWLPVKNDEGYITGMIKKADLLAELLHAGSFIEYQIGVAPNVQELSNLYEKFQHYLSLMIRQGILPSVVGKSMSDISDLITRRLITLAIEEIGEPPAEFVFIALGSVGRMEQTLSTDQDNAIIYREDAGSDPNHLQSWFSKLGEIVCDHLNTIGYRYCRGRIMASNPVYCKPMTTWKNYFSKWITVPEPRSLLEISIFFDLRAIYGNTGMVDELRHHIQETSSGEASFFYNLAENVLSFKPSLGLTGAILTEKKEDREYLDLKYALMPYVMFARLYSIFYKITPVSTSRRINALSEMKVIPETTCRDFLSGFHFLMQLRYRNQVFQLDHHEEPGNLLDIQRLTGVEEVLLKKVLSQVSELQSRLNLDFKRSIL